MLAATAATKGSVIRAAGGHAGFIDGIRRVT